RIFPVPADGRGLNPLLEDTNIMSHPPLLYAGFVGLTIPYTFAMAALATGRLDDDWVASVRRWTITAWFFLTMGNLVGAWWSYHVLGWGGYWAWDPVENAAILPWLPATAFLHSVQIQERRGMLQERRGMLKVWNLSLIIMAFSLTIFATFLTRSGVLSSVHAFSSGAVGAYLLIFLGIVLFGSLALLAWRSPLLKMQPELDSLICRESAFVMNNVIFVAATFTIFLGTIFPLLAEAVTGVKISVGAPYFNQITAPLFLLIVFLMGVGPLIAWRKASLDNLTRNFLWPATIAVALGMVLSAIGVRDFYPLLALTLCAFVVATIGLEFYRAVRARGTIAGENILQAIVELFQKNQRRYGGFVVHLGVVLIVMGIAVSMSYSVEKEATLKRGEELKVGRYSLLFDGLRVSEQSTHTRVEGIFQVSNDEHHLGRLTPALKFFPKRREPISRATFRSSLNEDLYLVLSGFSELEKEFATVRLLVRPMVSWIWIGGAIIALGTLIVLLPMRDDSRSSEQ
ncbi:heme lyase CcmF/NrfE family subunit, partial [bacterium]